MYTATLDGLSDGLQQMKINNHSRDFLDQIEQILSLYDESELHYSDKLVLYVMAEVEKFVLKPRSGPQKKCSSLKHVKNTLMMMKTLL